MGLSHLNRDASLRGMLQVWEIHFKVAIYLHQLLGLSTGMLYSIIMIKVACMGSHMTLLVYTMITSYQSIQPHPEAGYGVLAGLHHLRNRF